MVDEIYELFQKHPKVSTDSRKIESGSIFFALRGENFNGNQFAKQAIDNGCVASVVDDSAVAVDERFILVNDTLKALQDLARKHRNTLGTEIIAITGSNGKTTTKELISAVLRKKFNFHSTHGNLNNHIGVPLTLLQLKEEHELALVEMGANRPNDIKELCQIADPDNGIITNIGMAHLEGFGGFEGVINCKKQLYEHVMKKSGRIYFNIDDPLLYSLLDDYRNKFSYGKDRAADVVGRLVSADPYIKLKWFHGDYQSDIIKTNMIGTYNFTNMLAAICIGQDYTIPKAKINDALENYIPANNRSQVIQGKNTIILDAYNANPSSMEAAIRNLSEMEGRRKFAILGDMFELGPTSAQDHQNISDMLKNLGITGGLLVGEQFSQTDTPYDKVKTTAEAKKFLENANMEGSTILVKGSRKMQLETLVEAIS